MGELYERLNNEQKAIIMEVCEELRIDTNNCEIVVSDVFDCLAIKYDLGYYILDISVEEVR